MPILPINLCGDKILRKRVKKVHKVDEQIIRFIADMFETMHEAYGIGLAANQVGRDCAIITIDLSEVEGYEKSKPMVLINPKIKSGTGSCEYEEGCLSIPGVRVKVERPEAIMLEYMDTDLVKRTEKFDKLAARVIQHEVDHLNGKMFIDYLSEEEMGQYLEAIKAIEERKTKFEYKVTTKENLK